MNNKIKHLIFLCMLSTLLFACDARPELGLTQVKINRLLAETESLTADLEELHIEADEMISQILVPDVNWRWFEIQGGDWQSSELDLIFMKRRIRGHVAREASAQGVKAEPWDGYVLQYQGVLDGEGQRFIRVQGHCQVGSDYDPNVGIEVLDGGPCHFEMVFDPETNLFGRVLFNGQA